MDEPMSKFATALHVGRAFGVRGGMLRLGYELQRGSGLLSWKMKSVQGWDSWDLKRIAPGVTAEEMRVAQRDGTRAFFFSNPQTLAPALKNIVGIEGEKAILAQAESILAGNVPYFGQLSFACGFPPRWFQNPVTGQRVSPQQSWTQMRFASPVYGDLKFILEPSRFLFVFPLVRAYALSGDERYPLAFWSAIEDWVRQSPPMAGPLWICGQECSLRIVLLSYALHGFIHSPSTTDDRVALLISMISAHAWRTAQTLGYARSQRSNHLISEAVGLWTAGILYPELREAQVWRNLGTHLLEEAVLDQITPDGVSHQHSFNYQRMILHLLLWTLRLAEIHDAPLHEDIRTRTQAAFDFMSAWVDPVNGSAPNYGSDDGSLILPLTLGSYRDFRPLLQLGAFVLDRPALEPGAWDEAALWFGKKPAAAQVAKEDKLALPSAETGYFRLGDENSWALIRAGQYTRRPFQADQLHVDLWWQGMNIARDAGTYLYNGPPPWNNGLAGTAVHNTVTVDGRDQMRRAGRFLWLDWAQARGGLYSSNNHSYADKFEGEHDGYRKFGVKHRRLVQWLNATGWVIIDDIEGAGSPDVRLQWLAPDVPYQLSDAPFRVAFNSGQSQIRWNIFASVPGNALIVRAGKRIETTSANEVAEADIQLLGWESPTYGDLQPAVSLVYQTRSQLPVRFVTVVLTDERCRVETIDGEIVILKSESQDRASGKFEIYRVGLSSKGKGTAAKPLSPATRKHVTQTK
jgi:hypothetical protein